MSRAGLDFRFRFTKNSKFCLENKQYVNFNLILWKLEIDRLGFAYKKCNWGTKKQTMLEIL